jgi:chemotaxis protein methyltransferase CheR
MNTPATLPASKDSITPDNYTFLQQYIYRESGIVLEPGKQSLLDVRLSPIVKSARLQTINDLCALLKATAPTPYKRAVVEAMTTHETLFFRDNSAFEALRTCILPNLKTLRASNHRLSIWSAAASSGQEAYSIAMMLIETGPGSLADRHSWHRPFTPDSGTRPDRALRAD